MRNREWEGEVKRENEERGELEKERNDGKKKWFIHKLQKHFLTL